MTFGSVYEILTLLTTLRKTKFWDWFDGDDLRSWWTKTDIVGTNTFRMADIVDGGFEMITQSLTNAFCSIGFNGINHYSQIASRVECIIQRKTANALVDCGLMDNPALNDNLQQVTVGDESAQTNKFIRHANATVKTDTSLGVARDTVMTNYSIELGASDAKAFIAGVIRATVTTTLPTIPLEPVCRVFRNGVGAEEGAIRYFEAYST